MAISPLDPTISTVQKNDAAFPKSVVLPLDCAQLIKNFEKLHQTVPTLENTSNFELRCCLKGETTKTVIMQVWDSKRGIKGKD